MSMSSPYLGSMSQLQLKVVVSPLSTMLGTLTRRLLRPLGPAISYQLNWIWSSSCCINLWNLGLKTGAAGRVNSPSTNKKRRRNERIGLHIFITVSSTDLTFYMFSSNTITNIWNIIASGVWVRKYFTSVFLANRNRENPKSNLVVYHN